MHQRGQQRQLTLSPPTASTGTRSWLVVASFLGLVGTSGVGCNDKDTTDIVPVGGSGGSGGSAGTAGTAGSAGSAGSAGTAGTGGTGNETTDAGTDSGADAQPPGPDPALVARATAICQHLENVPDCASPIACVDTYVGIQEGLLGALPAACANEITDYYQCLADTNTSIDAGAQGFVCRQQGTAEEQPDVAFSDPNVDGYTACPDEEAAWLEAQSGNCPD